MTKIALIGAGSVVFTRRLLQDVVKSPALAGAHISLMDVDQERLDLVGRYAERLAADNGGANTVDATTDRAEALAAADYVITTIRVGDEPAVDHAIPLSYGVDQSVADTVGPGGVFKALRTIPVLLDVCRDMEAICPDAWLLQYTNPMAMACWAIGEATAVKTVGLCHSVQRTTADLADYIAAPRDSVSAWVAGINHMAWFLRLERDGQDAYPDLRRALDDDDTYYRDPVRFELMRRFGFFVTESTRHMSEYAPYFRTTPERKARYNLDAITSALSRLAGRAQEHFDTMQTEVEGSAPIEAVRSDEYASRIMSAMESGESTVINGNVLNEGLISNLPEGCCVEVPCLVDDLGIHSMTVGDIPPQLAALNRSNIAVQELGVKAVLEGSREAARHAVLLDPLTAASIPLDRIDEMFDALWDAHGDSLAAYS